MKINKNLACLISMFSLIGLSSVSCSSGGSTTNSSNALPQDNQGPVSLVEIVSIFNPNTAATKSSLQSNKSQTGGGCGSVMSATGAGLTAASGFFGLIPRVGPALAAVTNAAGSATGFIGAGSASACTQMQFTQINNQLAEQESQIQSLQTELNLDDNQLWSAVSSNSKNIAYGNWTALKTSYDQISGPGSFVNKFFDDAGFWVNVKAVQGVESAGYLLSNPQNYSQVQHLLNQWSYNSSTINIISLIDNMAGTSTLSNFSNYQQNNFTVSYPNVIVSQSTQLMDFYSSLYQAYKQELVSQLQLNNGLNIIPTIDEYNQIISATYQKSLGILLELYQIAYLSNQINYLSYLNGENTNNANSG